MRTAAGVSRAALAAALAMSLMPGAGAWGQGASQPANPYPPGKDYAGVSGSAAENARIEALCGANRNAKDGYVPTPALPGQTRAPQVKSAQGFKVEVVATLDRSVGLAFLPDGKLLLAQRAGG